MQSLSFKSVSETKKNSIIPLTQLEKLKKNCKYHIKPINVTNFLLLLLLLTSNLTEGTQASIDKLDMD